MKKWIFPLTLVLCEITILIIFLSPNLSKILPEFLFDFLSWIEKGLTSVSKFLRLPVSDINGETNATISNIIVIVTINIIALSVYFIICAAKKRKMSKKEIREVELPKSEFDPILFERRMPKRRLAFIWVPLNIWIIEFIVLNSKDFQGRIQKNMPFLYRLMDNTIEFYDANLIPGYNDDVFMRAMIFTLGLLVVVFIYWSFLSILASALNKPFARMKAEKALKDHEKRLALCQKEENIVENLDIIEHAKFKHDKSIVETIAKVQPKNDLKHIRSKSTYFDYISHGITDLGVVEREIKPIERPRIERKPIKIIYPSESFEGDNAVVAQVNKIEDKDDTPLLEEDNQKERIELSPKLNVFASANKTEINSSKEEATEEIKVKPLQPIKLRIPVNVSPVKPFKKTLKEKKSDQPIVEIE